MKLSGNAMAALRQIAAASEGPGGGCGVTPSLWAAAKSLLHRGHVCVVRSDPQGHPIYSITPKGRTALEAFP